MLRRVALVRTDVAEELSASFIRVTRIGELGTTQAATSSRRTLRLIASHAFTPGLSYFPKTVITTADIIYNRVLALETDMILSPFRRQRLTLPMDPT
jgi:hypothetical protein